jgi:hypothetical protein
LPGKPTDADNLDEALDAILNPIRASIHLSVGRGLIDNRDGAPVPNKLFLRRGLTRLSKAQAEAFYERLDALIKEFEAMKPDSESDAYRLLIGLFPVVSHPPAHDEG